MGAATACVATLGAGTAMAAPPAPDTAFPGAVPSWANPANDQGPAPAATSVEGEIYLPLRDQAGAEKFATAVSAPDNELHKHWLSPEKWISAYSPSQEDSDAVVAHLTSLGMTISAVPDSRQYVVFRGSADQINKVFKTALHSYAFQGTTLVGPSTVPSLPSSLAAKVAGVSIDQSRLMTKPDLEKQDAATNGACSRYFGQNQQTVPPAYGKNAFSTALCGYTPKQIQSAYGLADLAGSQPDGHNGSQPDGHGQTVAIVDAYASPTMRSDINTYSKANGLPAMTGKSYKEVVPSPSEFVDQASCGFPSGWQGEQALDVDAVHGSAPGANILYVGGFNCGGGMDVAMSKILDHKLANIVSNSYGNVGEALPADAIAGEVNLQLQAAGEGIGLYFSSGDNGDEAARLGFASPDFPASSPWVTAVGGTSLAVGEKGNYLFETAWGNRLDKIVTNPDGTQSYLEPIPGTIFGGGAGGGVSAVFAQPAYQAGVVPATLAKGHRVSPDVASLADPYTGYTVGLSAINNDDTLSTSPYATVTYGGTSLASPLTAGQVAVAQQISGEAIGFANPALYSLALSNPDAFNDVQPAAGPAALAYTSRTTGNRYLVSLDHDTSLATTKGYDNVTGVGSMSYRVATAMASH
ncbi:MAG: S53 family peptidase [Actinomycetota bacterium]|nr:S53 family peptidase [Actinomycetota bacterium]